MTPEQRARFLVVHKSDAVCLAKLNAKLNLGIDADNAPRRIGSACARAAEALAYEIEGEKTSAEMLAVARAAIEANAATLKMPPEEVGEAVAVMAGALAPGSMLRFGKPSGWESAAEWQWALDRNFNPVPFGDPRAICAGTIDLAMWQESEGRASATDDKATKSFQGHDDVQGFEAWLYSLAMIQTFGVRSSWFYYRNLRAGYRVGDELHKSEPWFETVKAIVRARRAEREVAVEMDEFPETMGPDCQWCPIKHRCAAQRKAAQDGAAIDPAMPPDEIARRYLGLKAMVADYEAAAQGVVEESGEPIAIGHGLAYGLKPVSSWRVAGRFTGPDGRERLMRFLRDYGMTTTQESEWFGFVPDARLAGAVKTAVYELLGREAGRFLDDASVSPIEPVTRWEMSAWMPTTGKRAPAKQIEEVLDEIDW